jgi:hypothetical protein
MKHVDTYDKTVNGKNEVTDNAAGLSMMERRVLILVNGENEVEKLAKLSLCDDIDATLDRLLELGLIQVAETTLVEIAPQAAPEKAAAADDVTVTARDLMCNTLQTFGNKVKIAGLHQTIQTLVSSALGDARWHVPGGRLAQGSPRTAAA